MQIGDLVKLLGSPWLGAGIVTALHTSETALVYFPNAGNHTFYSDGVEIWRERLEVINEATSR